MRAAKAGDYKAGEARAGTGTDPDPATVGEATGAATRAETRTGSAAQHDTATRTGSENQE